MGETSTAARSTRSVTSGSTCPDCAAHGHHGPHARTHVDVGRAVALSFDSAAERDPLTGLVNLLVAASARRGPWVPRGDHHRPLGGAGRLGAAAVLVTVLVPPQAAAATPSATSSRRTARCCRSSSGCWRQFRVPVLSGTTVVVHQPGGLSLLTRADSALWALGTTQDVLEGPQPPPPGTIQAAIPVPTGRSDTTVTYLYARGHRPAQHRPAGRRLRSPLRQPDRGPLLRHRFRARAGGADRLPRLTARPVRDRQRAADPARRRWPSGPSSPPWSCSASPASATSCTSRCSAGWPPCSASRCPASWNPSCWPCSSASSPTTASCSSPPSATSSTRPTTSRPRDGRSAHGPVVAVAGLTVAGGTIALLAAPFAIFRGLGPALALTVLVGLALCLTLAPALMTMPAGGCSPCSRSAAPPAGGPRVEPPRAGSRLDPVRHPAHPPRPCARRHAAVVVVLGLAVFPLAGARLDLSFTAGLPQRRRRHQGAQLLDDAGLRGITAPTEVLLEQDGVTGQRPPLARLQQQIAAQPGVSRVIGPADLPSAQARGTRAGDIGRRRPLPRHLRQRPARRARR